MEKILIYEQLAKVNKAIKPIEKGQTNQQQNFKYRGIDDIIIQLHDLFAENEIVIAAKILNSSREERTNQKGTTLIWSIVDYQFRFIATDGTYFETEARGEAMDSGDKGSNKTNSSALKYALIDAFTIPIKDREDNDSGKDEIESILIDGMLELEGCNTQEEYAKTWKKYPTLQKNEKFYNQALKTAERIKKNAKA